MKKVIVIPEIDNTLREVLKKHLGSRTEDVRSLVREFHNVLVKQVASRPRAVYLSEDLKKHPLYTAEKRKAIDAVISRIERGETIEPYLSDRSVQLGQYDLSLAHFGVHHLHLGDTRQERGSRAGRVKGTKSLLFARFTESEAYFLDILNHGMRSGFLNMHLFRVMCRNWPDSVESFRAKQAIGVSVKYTDDQAAELLENNVNLVVEIAPQQVFMLPGMGTTTAGTPLAVERRVDRNIDELRSIVRLVKENPSAVAALIMKLTRIGHNVIRLRVRARAGVLDIYDASSGCIFNLQNSDLVVSVPDGF